MPRVEFLGLGTGVSSGGDGRSVALAWSAMGRPHLGQASAASLTSPLQSVHLISAMVLSLWVANGRPSHYSDREYVRKPVVSTFFFDNY